MGVGLNFYQRILAGTEKRFLRALKKILYDSNLRKSTLKYAMKKSKEFELNRIQEKLVNIFGSA